MASNNNHNNDVYCENSSPSTPDNNNVNNDNNDDKADAALHAVINATTSPSPFSNHQLDEEMANFDLDAAVAALPNQPVNEPPPKRVKATTSQKDNGSNDDDKKPSAKPAPVPKLLAARA